MAELHGGDGLRHRSVYVGGERETGLKALHHRLSTDVACLYGVNVFVSGS